MKSEDKNKSNLPIVANEPSLGVQRTGRRKATLKTPKGVRVANRQAWVDTFVYLCPNHRGGVGPGEYCEDFDGTRTNCTGRGTYTGSGACEHVMRYFQTYIKFLNKELEF